MLAQALPTDSFTLQLGLAQRLLAVARGSLARAHAVEVQHSLPSHPCSGPSPHRQLDQVLELRQIRALHPGRVL